MKLYKLQKKEKKNSMKNADNYLLSKLKLLVNSGMLSSTNRLECLFFNFELAYCFLFNKT